MSSLESNSLSVNNVLDSISIISGLIRTDSTPDCRFSAFYATRAPRISLKDFIERILVYSKIDKATFITMMIYLDRAKDELEFTYLNIHRLILGSLITAIKYCNDDLYPNTFYARIGGISLDELNMIEIAFCALLGFEFYIEREIYDKYEEVCYRK